MPVLLTSDVTRENVFVVTIQPAQRARDVLKVVSADVVTGQPVKRLGFVKQVSVFAVMKLAEITKIVVKTTINFHAGAEIRKVVLPELSVLIMAASAAITKVVIVAFNVVTVVV